MDAGADWCGPKVGAPPFAGLSGLGHGRKLLFPGGLVIFVILLHVMSSILWTIDIIGADAVQEGMIREILCEMGGITRWALRVIR